MKGGCWGWPSGFAFASIPVSYLGSQNMWSSAQLSRICKGAWYAELRSAELFIELPSVSRY